MEVIPQQDVTIGDKITHNGVTYVVDEHFSQGKDLVGSKYTHIMYSNKGAFGMVEHV